MAKWLLFILLCPVLAFSEYRVFKLKITDTKKKKSRFVHSTLDWIQYRDYHHLQSNETVTLEDTWMCWKRKPAPYAPLCKRPVTQATLKAESEGLEGQEF